MKHVVLLNCGATIDICDFLDPPDDVIFYILDNHRPVDVTNIYNDGQVWCGSSVVSVFLLLI